LRLAIVTTEYPPFTPEEGGIGTLYASLVPKLVDLDQEVDVFALSHDREGGEYHRGVRLHHLRPANRTIGSFLERVAWSAAAARAVRRQGPFDLVWAAEWSGSAWAYSRRRDAGPLVTQLHTSLTQVMEFWGGWPRSLPKLLEFRAQDFLERRQTEHSDAIIAQTRAILEWTERLWDIAKLPVRILPSVLDVTRTRTLGEGLLPDDLPEGRPRIVFFGRLEPRKGLDILVQAMPLVWEEFPEARLIIFGNGTEELARQLRRLAGSNARRLHLMGHRSSTELFPAVRAADVVALPSRWENFALSALETMALGRPVVLTTAGGAPEFCNDGVDALLVPPADSEALGLAIRRLLESTELRERLGKEAAKTAERYDVSAVAPRYLSYFDELLATR
jgi:glycogen(starch) synthase